MSTWIASLPLSRLRYVTWSCCAAAWAGRSSGPCIPARENPRSTKSAYCWRPAAMSERDLTMRGSTLCSLTLPVSWRGTIAQYAGRLHRLNDRKREVRIYDYADLDVPMLARMFDRRCRGYQADRLHDRCSGERGSGMAGRRSLARRSRMEARLRGQCQKADSRRRGCAARKSVCECCKRSARPARRAPIVLEARPRHFCIAVWKPCR